MADTNLRIEKIIQKSFARDILYLLSQKDLTIKQIASNLKTDNIQLIVAFLFELHYLGLVTPNEIQHTKKNGIEDKIDNYVIRETFLPNPSVNRLSPLGIPIKDYHSLWQSLDQDRSVTQDKILEEITFRVPEPLKQRFKNIELQNKKV